VGIHTDYYVNDVYVLSDDVEGVIAYSFLIVMVLTSFSLIRIGSFPCDDVLLCAAAHKNY
jgi:hypothetical protein